MKLLLLAFLFLLASAEAARKFNSPYALPGDYLDKKDEDYDDDDEKTTNAEQSPENPASTSVSHLGDEEDLLKESIQNFQEKTKFTTTRDAEEEEQSSQEEEEISQEEQELESRLGPHYHSTPPWSDNDELPLDVTDTGNWPTVKETKEEDFKVQLLLAVLCATLVWSLVFMLFCCAALVKYNIEKRNFCKKSRCSGEKQKPFATSFADLPKIVTDSPISKSAERCLWPEKIASEIPSNEKSTKSETVPLLESALVMPPISHGSDTTSFISNEDSNEEDG